MSDHSSGRNGEATGLRSLAARLPGGVTRTVRGLAIASLVSQVLIVVTGGAVRLTASGLGCPTWPQCTAESLINTPEMGIHGIIEFGNRTLTFVLTFIAFAMLLAVWRFRRQRRDLFFLSIALLAGIPAQALIGGITVLTQLNPWVVGWHFIVSMTLIALATLLVNRARPMPAGTGDGHGPTRASTTVRQVLVAIGVLTAITVMLGVIVTGSGPHAGDADAPRNGLDPELMTRIHVAPVYLLVAATAAALILVYRRHHHRQLRQAMVMLAVVVLLQGMVGYIQHFTGLPVMLVALHMLGASLLVCAATNAIDKGLGRGLPPVETQPSSSTARLSR
ncbi:COX15/CtaA family protein [Arthrobacter castelli]|uniref:COX15/CtaA family protein n=1 Tax=Arthrobacter castelli TaxID=271431 RepID=UPI00040E6F8E|nr:COX15/CtaA family protein [Arthrobacter castelli]